MDKIQNLIAKDLLSIKAVFFRPEEPFTWASGIKRPISLVSKRSREFVVSLIIPCSTA